MQKGVCKIGNIDLYYETLGNLSFGIPCVMIPGAMQGAWGWSDSFCQHFLDQGNSVVRFDHRDIGRSTESEDKDYDLMRLTKDVLILLKHLGCEKAHFIGHSMGGHICQEIALNYPKYAKSITMIGSGPICETEAEEEPLTEEEENLLGETWGVFLSRQDSDNHQEHVEGFIEVYRYLNADWDLDDGLARHYVEEMIQHSSKSALQPGNPHEKVMQKVFEAMSDRRGDLRKIQTPSLIIHGENDPISLPRYVKAMAKELPSVKLTLIKNMGHMFLNKDLEKRISQDVLNFMASV